MFLLRFASPFFHRDCILGAATAQHDLSRWKRQACAGLVALVAGIALSVALPAGPVAATEHIVKMLNIDPDDPDRQHVFEPEILFIEPGDTVTFVAGDRGHNSATKRGMLPEGAEPWNGGMDEEISVTLTVPGTYGYVCLPHLEMGMVGLILVGDYTVNFDEARKVRHIGRARTVFRQLFDEVEKMAGISQ